jgi:translation initiation factor IF-2
MKKRNDTAPAAVSAERPPIVVVMGHVDHGKSTLLDYIRKQNTVAREAGGITQHVAAYEVEREKDGAKKRITFIDTPGHAAFGSIRKRGANVADIAILVVAADDGVKAQTLEALESIKSADIPFIVAINKIDKPNANVERTQASLLEKGVYLEKLGGDVPWAAISAKEGTGVDELLDLILLVAEVHELKGDAKAPAEGYVLEAHRDRKRGIAATLIVTNGRLESGMTVLAGSALSPVRIMENSAGKAVREAPISSPAVLIGFDELPAAGDLFRSFKSKRDAEEARSEARAARTQTRVDTETGDERFFMPLIVRADTTGSEDAITHEAGRIGDEHAAVRVVQSGIGIITEGDVKSALASKTTPVTVVGFNVSVDPLAAEYARQHGVRVETFDIIYKMTERLEELLRESAPRRVVEEVVGKAKVLKQFSSRKDEHVVGGSVLEGYVAKGASVRVLRRGTLIGVGKIRNLQTNKQNVERVDTGSEFGTLIEAVFEITQGDTLECFVTVTK